MISVDEAIKFADQHFPHGPEKLADYLKVDVRYSELIGCDGWCLCCGERTIIRVSSTLSASRQRFTLAHELGHLVLGIPSVVGESMSETLASDSSEERRVNEFAAKILLPQHIVKGQITSVPIPAYSITQLAKKANISAAAAMLRIANLAPAIGLENAAVAHFSNDQLKWIWSRTLIVPKEAMTGLVTAAREVHPNPLRHQQGDGRVVVASIFENKKFSSATLFLQLLPADRAMATSPYERRLQLEAKLLGSTCVYKERLQGIFGALKGKWSSAEESEQDFWRRHTDTFKGTSLNSSDGREYVRLRILEWFS